MANKIIIILILLLIIGCSSVNTESEREVIVQNISSPDKTVNAIVTKYGYGGATGSFVYKIYLQSSESAKNISELKPLLFAERVEFITIKWTSLNTLALEISSEKIINFRNFWWNDEKNMNFYIKIKS